MYLLVVKNVSPRLLHVAQMESILSEFTDTLPSINKQIYSTYLAHVTNLSRRFFHLLLRYCQYMYMYM